MSSLLRFKMVDAAINHTAVEVEAPEGRPSDYFGQKVFGRDAMRKYLNKATYDALCDTMQNGTPLTREVADAFMRLPSPSDSTIMPRVDCATYL